MANQSQLSNPLIWEKQTPSVARLIAAVATKLHLNVLPVSVADSVSLVLPLSFYLFHCVQHNIADQIIPLIADPALCPISKT